MKQEETQEMAGTPLKARCGEKSESRVRAVRLATQQMAKAAAAYEEMKSLQQGCG